MKRILDRLLARQQRLLNALAEPPAAPHPAAAPASSRSDPERVIKERAAVEAALAALSIGDIRGAGEQLRPLARGAVYVPTLTYLAGIASVEGRLDESLALLEQAETLDQTDATVWRLLAEAYAAGRRFDREAQYRRKLVFAQTAPSAETLVPWVRAIVKSTPAGKKLPLNEIRLALDKLASVEDDDQATRTQMAEVLYAAGLADDARQLYAKATPLPDGYVDTTAQWLRMIDRCQSAGVMIHTVANAGVPGHRPMIAELHDVTIHPGLQWIPVLDAGQTVLQGHVMQRLKMRRDDPGSPLLLNSDRTALLRLPRDMPTIDAPALLIGGVPAYYHHTVEFLSALAIAERTGVGADLPLVVNDDLADFQLEQFELLGIQPSRLIRIAGDAPVRFRKLHVPSRLVRGGRWLDPLISGWYRERFGLLDASAPPPSRRLYLSRTGTTRRRVANDEDVIKAVVSRGFEIVQPETMSVQEQVALFAQASDIAGPTGAAFTNMLFSPPGARVLVLYNQHLVEGGGDLYFDAMAASCGHHFASQSCLPATVRSGERVIDADLQVDVDALLAALDGMETAKCQQH